jgi:hypothetical protein
LGPHLPERAREREKEIVSNCAQRRTQHFASRPLVQCHTFGQLTSFPLKVLFGWAVEAIALVACEKPMRSVSVNMGIDTVTMNAQSLKGAAPMIKPTKRQGREDGVGNHSRLWFPWDSGEGRIARRLHNRAGQGYDVRTSRELGEDDAWCAQLVVWI